MIETEHLEGGSLDIAAIKRRAILEIFPEAATEGGEVDLERLRVALGDSGRIGKERFEMTWPGKVDCFKTIQSPSMATLLPVSEKSINFETTENLIVEGDNLEVLKLLQKSYLGKIKMIYIDPPYNTGNDFIYPDDYSESLQTYLQYTGQADTEGRKFGSNSETDGRFHSKWLSMMYPRLYLARNLLQKTGMLVAQIGDTELPNLRRLLDEIFGEENYINTVVVKAKVSAGASGGGEDKRLKKNVEFILIYARDASELHAFSQCFTEEPLAEVIQQMREAGQSWKYTNVLLDEGSRRQLASIQDGDGNPIDVFIHDGVRRTSLKDVCERDGIDEHRGYRKYLSKLFSDTNAQTSIRTRVIEAVGPLHDGQMYSVEYVPASGRDKGNRVKHFYISPTVRRVIWLSDVAYERDGDIIKRERTGTLWDNISYNNIGKEGGMAFPNGKKPVELLRRVLRLSPDKDDLVLDFFAGSGTTAHAILSQNQDDGGNRRFILVQLPEPSGQEDYPTIADIAEERVRRVITSMREANDGTLQLTPPKNVDLGFRVFKLAQSNIEEWNANIPHDVELLAEQLSFNVDHLRSDRTDADILYEVILKSGYPLSAKVRTEFIAGRPVYSILDGSFLICLERNLTLDLLRSIAERDPERVLLLDEGFAGNDHLKTNAVQTFKAREIVFRTL